MKCSVCKLKFEPLDDPTVGMCSECKLFLARSPRGCPISVPEEAKEIKVPVAQSFAKDLASSFEDIDVVRWCEKYVSLPDSDGPFGVNNCGRDYLKEPFYYITGKALSKEGKPTVIVKGRQIGFSVASSALYFYLLNCGLYTNLRVLHAFPSLLNSASFNDEKIEVILSKSEHIRRRTYTPETMQFDEDSKTHSGKPQYLGKWTQRVKQFQDNNFLVVDATSKDSGRLRGQTFHVIFYDEVQDMTRKAIENLEETLTTSPYGPPGLGVKVYFGTPFNEGTHFHALWLKTDQRFYQLRCHTCKKLYPFYQYGSNAWRDIWVKKHTVKCPLCGALEDKREAVKDGAWVPTNPGAPIRGYHFNQLYVPTLTKESILSKETDKAPQQFQNEVLGEFYTGAMSGDSYRELVLSCADDQISYPPYIEPYTTTAVTLGVDWGGKIDERSPQGSYTYVLILSHVDGKMRVEKLERVDTRDPSEQVKRVRDLFVKYSVIQGIGDMGYGLAQIYELQKEFSRRFLGCHSVSAKNIYNYNEASIPPFVSVNKDMVIDEVLSQFRNSRFILPYKTTEDQFITEALAEETAGLLPTEKIVNGNRIKVFGKRGAKTIDGFMALMYAYIAMRFRLSGGFTTGAPLVYGGGSRSMPLPRKVVNLSPNFVSRMKPRARR